MKRVAEALGVSRSNLAEQARVNLHGIRTPLWG
jgi:hypothetical protein